MDLGGHGTTATEIIVIGAAGFGQEVINRIIRMNRTGHAVTITGVPPRTGPDSGVSPVIVDGPNSVNTTWSRVTSTPFTVAST